MVRLTVIVLLAVSVAAYAQPQPNALGSCLADNTSGRDRKDLAGWIFLAMAAHPEIKQYASANRSAVADESARTMAALVTRLLTESCASETKAVIKAGGSFDPAFRNLGELAMQELMAETSVKESMGHFVRYLDQERFEKLRAGE
jgi:hypothetical protein